MAARRAPLASVPNAINSPFRSTQPTNAKRTRAQAGENTHGQPPAKKQIIEIKSGDEENVEPRRRSAVSVISNEKEEPFGKRTSNHQPTAFEKKLLVAKARERKPVSQSQQHAEKPQKDNLESVRQWQRHYKRQFPGFVFYFDNVPDDVRLRATRQIQSLGAREEKFFSKSVTHVVTTRQIPAESAQNSPDDEQVLSQRDEAHAKTGGMLSLDQRKTTNLLDASLQRRAHAQTANSHDADGRRGQTHAAADVLTKARELNIKIWAQEKLTRVLNTMLQSDANDQAATHDTRPAAAVNSRATTKATKNADLEQLLRNEKVNGPADRDMTVAAQDMSTFRGCYIYVHDMDEKTKPVMVRDYPKPATKDQGKWPQFRLTQTGRCPFIDDPAYSKKLMEQDRRAAAETKAQQEIAAARRTRAASMEQKGALVERQANLRRSPRKLSQADDLAKPLDPPKVVPAKRQAEISTEDLHPMFGSAQVRGRALPRTIGGEPIASGIQHSNVTSAIRSQVMSSNISSTAPGMNRRVTDSKEVSALKRKVLERGASVNSAQSVPSMNDLRAAVNNEEQGPPPRAAKRRAQETLGVLHEDDESGAAKPRPRKAAPRRKAAEREKKPGYCENCRDKYDDFDDHIISRKHRRFAITPDNWTELDALLCQLKRPHKDHPPARPTALAN